jgi:mRNA-degrading endonuclease RelE of RelBE toxin-antitoxin system
LVKIGFSDSFVRAAKQLAKKYRHFESDLQPLLDRIATGETPGDQIPGVGHPVYKVRVPNTDAQAGKRGGYRVIYYLQTADAVFLITVYSKTTQTDIPLEHIRRIISEEITAPPTAED